MLISGVKRYSVNIIHAAIFILVSALLHSCAQIVAPGGGKKDSIPPRVLKYTPDSASVNFNSKLILIDFDELIQLKDLNSQLIISPPLNKTPDISVKNKTLTVALDKKEELKPNTTYCISFGNAIQDINEGNPYENFKYVFSTGSYIDSLSLKGKVENGFNHTTEKNILVMLYGNPDDSVIYKELPDYFTKTKDDGTFQINNIRAGKYKIVALKDGNTNYKYDGEGESIGFIDALIDVSENKNYLIDLFQEPPKRVYLKKQIHDQYGKVVLVFNQGSDSLHVSALNEGIADDQVLLDFSKNKDTLTYWIKNFEKDTLKLQVRNGSRVLDTVEFKMIKKADALKSTKRPLKLFLLNSLVWNQTFDLNNELTFVFSQPIADINTKTNVFLKQDTLDYKNYQQLVYLRSSLSPQTITIGLSDSLSQMKNKSANSSSFPSNKIPLKENTAYHLFIPPGTFTDIFGITNDTIKINFKTREEKYYGSVKLKMTISEVKGDYIVQLLDDKENIVRENRIRQSETLLYNYLAPQKYMLKVIYDENDNGKWDTGNYLKKIQPEKVIYNSEAINVRSDWDVDLQWFLTKEK